MRKVEKRGCAQEEFIPEKVVCSCVKAGVPVEIAREIAEAVARDVGESITSEELRYRVLEMIRDRNREWEANWFLFERAVKRRSTC
jgi:hypothetical protein